MAVILTGTGGIWKRLGHAFGAAADVVALKGGAATARVLSGASMQTRGTTFEADAAEAPSLSQVTKNSWDVIESWQATQSGFLNQLKALASAILVKQVQLDANLPDGSANAALTELARQMTATADSINASTVAAGAQTAVGTPTGNPVVVLSLKGGRGYIGQTQFAEVLRFAVTADAQTGGATARQEALSVKGQAAVTDVFSHLWPGGSGASKSLTLVDAQLDNAGGNLLTNGDFETFTTANNPDNWTITVGVAGTNVFASGSTDAYTQSNALKIVGDVGGTLTALTQYLNHATSTIAGAGGTPGKVAPLTQYLYHAKIKGGDALAAGVLEFALVDGAGTVINDAQGVANLTTHALNAVTTSYVSVSGAFRLPAVLPSAVKLRVRTSTALASTKILYIDDLALAPAAALYDGGPQAAAFAGATPVILGDSWTLAVTNTMGALASWMERFFGLRAAKIVIPYSGSPTVADGLVV
jgi:hypothetical protein